MKIEGAVIGVGFLMLQRIPRGMLVAESTLDNLFEPALQEFKDDAKVKLHQDFEPPPGFRQITIDHVKRFLEEKGYLK